MIVSGSHVYVVGIDPSPSLTEAQIEAFDQFYASVHLPEVLDANRGFSFGRRFELVRDSGDPAPGPRWLAAYEVDDQDSAEEYLRGQGAGVTVAYTDGPVPWTDMPVRWRVMLAVTGTAGDPLADPSEILLYGSARAPAPGDGHRAQSGTFDASQTYEVIANLREVDPCATYITAHVMPADLTAHRLSDLDAPTGAATWQLHYRRTGELRA